MKALVLSAGLALAGSLALGEDANRAAGRPAAVKDATLPAPANLTMTPTREAGVAQIAGPALILDNGFAYQHHASTLQEGIGRAQADVLRSSGVQVYLNSLAAKNFGDAERIQIENTPRHVDAYFQCRTTNQHLRTESRGPRLTSEDRSRLARAAAAARRLSPADLDARGRANWPILLQADGYAEYRNEMEGLLAQRASAGRLGLTEHRKIGQLANTMVEMLKADIASVAPVDYVAARRFLTGLANEAAYNPIPAMTLGASP